MALRDNPYLSLYVQDFLTDEKLSCCSLSTQGVYIRIMCILHKSETYGGILFKQIPKQNLSSIQYFAYILSKQTGVECSDMVQSIEELLFFEVLKIEERDGVDFLFQKRMVKDFNTSINRSNAGKKGGGNPNLFKQTDKQNTENEYEYNNIGDKDKEGVGEKGKEEDEKEKSYRRFNEWILTFRFRALPLLNNFLEPAKMAVSTRFERYPFLAVLSARVRLPPPLSPV